MPSKSKSKIQHKDKNLPTSKELAYLFKKHPDVELVRKITSISEPGLVNKEAPLEPLNSYRF